MLGEKSPTTNEIVMEQEADIKNTVTIREESQDAIAEIRQIMSTPIIVNGSPSDIEMNQQDPDAEKNEVTITAIIEELIKSMSSKGNNSTKEEPQGDSKVETFSSNHNNVSTQGSEGEIENHLVINGDTLEQSIRDELQDSLLGEAPMNQQPKDITQVDAITTTNTLQYSNSSEWLIPRDKFERMDDPESLEDILIYDVVVEYQDIIEVKAEPRDIVEGNQSKSLKLDTSRDELKPTTMSQVMISH